MNLLGGKKEKIKNWQKYTNQIQEEEDRSRSEKTKCNKIWLERGCWLCMLPPSFVCTESDRSDWLITWFVVSWTAPSPDTIGVAATMLQEAVKRDQVDHVVLHRFIMCHCYDLFIYFTYLHVFSICLSNSWNKREKYTHTQVFDM